MAPAFLPTALSGSLFLFQPTQYVQVFPLKPAPFCTLFSGLRSTDKPALSLLLLSDSRFVLSSIFPFISNSCGRSGRNCLLSPPVLSGYNGSPDTRFSRGTMWIMSWPVGERYLRPRSLSPLFSDWRRMVSSKFFDTQVPSIFTEELLLPRHARCLLSSLRCNGHSLLLSSSLSRIGRIENPSGSAYGHLSSHSALSNYGLFAPLTLWGLWSKPWGVARLLGLQVLPPCPHFPEGVG